MKKHEKPGRGKPEPRHCGRSEPSAEINQKQASVAGTQRMRRRVCNTNCQGSHSPAGHTLSQEQREAPGRCSACNIIRHVSEKPLWLLHGEWIGGVKVGTDGPVRLLLKQSRPDLTRFSSEHIELGVPAIKENWIQDSIWHINGYYLINVMWIFRCIETRLLFGKERLNRPLLTLTLDQQCQSHLPQTIILNKATHQHRKVEPRTREVPFRVSLVSSRLATGKKPSDQTIFITLGQLQKCHPGAQEDGICLHVAGFVIPNLQRNNKFWTQKLWLVLAAGDEEARDHHLWSIGICVGKLSNENS